MAVDLSLFQVLNSLSIEDKEAMAVGSASTLTSIKVLDVIASLSLNSTTIIRRLPFDPDVNKLGEWKEKVAVLFYRFLQEKPFFFSYTDVEGCSHILDSNEKIESVFKLHQQRCTLMNEPGSLLLPSQLKFEIMLEDSLSSILPETLEPFARHECVNKDLVTCECDVCGQMATIGLGYKCLDCNNIHICENCETINEKHDAHLLIPCLVLILGTERNYIVRQTDGLIQLVGGGENKNTL